MSEKLKKWVTILAGQAVTSCVIDQNNIWSFVKRFLFGMKPVERAFKARFLQMKTEFLIRVMIR